MASAKWKQFSKEQLQDMAKQARSMAQFLQLMGYAAQGGNITRVKQELLATYPDLDLSHFTGQGWLKGHTVVDRLDHEYSGRRRSVLRALEAQRGHQCECCKLTEWNNQPIPLEVHHRNGDNTDNSVDNLMLLCPNCHALTDTYRGKNIGRVSVSEEQFVEALQQSTNIRQALILLGLSPKGANYARAHDLIYKYNITHLM